MLELLKVIINAVGGHQKRETTRNCLLEAWPISTGNTIEGDGYNGFFSSLRFCITALRLNFI